jgi:hypothetical protein
MSSSRKASMSASIGGVEKEKSAGTGGGSERAGTSSSKAYSSHLAVQTDATKYRGKYKELKKKVRQIEIVSLNVEVEERRSLKLSFFAFFRYRRMISCTSRRCESSETSSE